MSRIEMLAAAERFKAAEPDGWYVDPEAVLAWEETLYDWPAGTLAPDWEETLRGWWRAAEVLYRTTGSGMAAAEMVEIERLHGLLKKRG